MVTKRKIIKRGNTIFETRYVSARGWKNRPFTERDSWDPVKKVTRNILYKRKR